MQGSERSRALEALLASIDQALPDAAAAVAGVRGGAERLHSPCADGDLVWRRFGAGGPSLALLHGGYGSWNHWVGVLPALARRFRVLCVDLPGLGDSATVPPPYDATSLARIIAAGLERVLEPGERAHLVGFSFGGVLGGHVALAAAARVRSLTLVGANGLGLARPPMEALAKAPRDAPLETLFAVHRRNLGLLMLHRAASIDERATYVQTVNVLRARTRSRPISMTDTLRVALAQLRVPFAGVWGECDATAGELLPTRRELLRSLRADAPFEVVPGAGHWVAYEAPQAFEAALARIIERFED